jgi:exodeoxyribonuclease VII small subunit
MDPPSGPAHDGTETGASAAPARRRCAVSDEESLDPAADIASLSFDEALAELQRTVAELEQGGLPLERSLALYERGVALHERCATLLGEADLRVQRLLERSSGALEVAEARAGEALDQE